jgi:hypothetical protein
MEGDKVQVSFGPKGRKGLAQELNGKANIANQMPQGDVIRFSPAPEFVTNSKLPVKEKLNAGCFPPSYYLALDASSRFACEPPVAKRLDDYKEQLPLKRTESATEADFLQPVAPELR